MDGHGTEVSGAIPRRVRGYLAQLSGFRSKGLALCYLVPLSRSYSSSRQASKRSRDPIMPGVTGPHIELALNRTME
jgi:hypothetical protein